MLQGGAVQAGMAAKESSKTEQVRGSREGWAEPRRCLGWGCAGEHRCVCNQSTGEVNRETMFLQSEKEQTNPGRKV